MKLHWRILCFTLLISGNCLVRNRTLLHFSVSVGTQARLNLCISYVCCQNLCDFICASVLLCMEETVSFRSAIPSAFQSSHLLSTKILEHEWMGLIKIFILWLSVLEHLTLSTLARSVCFCVNSHLLQEQAFFIWVDQRTDLQV